ncbi:single-stranded DNA-binding protein [uncultured Caudovirales phage]|uniref:Single-stranded DNA-binding protein n=1 Tax=uncultured Caudovirales phage TaxID=2100421 RepID=A0A6J5LZB3_9CAUD|nr:single-stranded DNA-binding protein [uncultured Caudovirales phage]
MSEKPQRLDTITSPRGEFVWPRLTAPDTKFNAAGEYNIGKFRVAADQPDVKALIARIEKLAAETLAEAKKNAKNPAEARKWETKNRPYEMELDAEGNETGIVIFKAKMTATGVSVKTGKPWTRKPALFDARGKPIVGDIVIGNGSVGRFCAELMPYAKLATGASVSLRLVSAQIIQRKDMGSSKAAGDYGFGAEDDGSGWDDETTQGAASGDDDDLNAGGGEDDGSGDF